MKKIACILAAITASGALCGLSACKKDDLQTVEPSEITFANFEQWGPDFQLMRLMNNFGVVTRNEDTAFVKSGKYSAKLQPTGPYLEKKNPIVYLPTTSLKFEYDYKDFTKFERISAYLYNASDKEQNATIGLVSTISKPKEILTAPGETITLAPGKWTRLDYWLEMDLLSLSMDITNVQGIYFEFDNAGLLYPDDAPVIYLDDITIGKSAQEREIPNPIVLDETNEDGVWKKEICDFEKPYQKYIMQSKLAGPPEYTFETSVVKATDYGLTATSGEKILRVVQHPRINDYYSYSYLVLPERVIQESGIHEIPESEWKKTYFCYDIYRVGDGSKSRYTTTWFTTAGGKGLLHPKKLKNGEFMKWEEGTYYRDNTWATVKWSLYELANMGEVKGKYVKELGYMQIPIQDYVGDADIEWYLDNFRLETGAEVYVKPQDEQQA